MAKVIYNHVVIAESDSVQVVEGNLYFPPESIKTDYFKPSSHHTVCPWKGTASYYNIEVNGETANNAAWYYPETKSVAKDFENYVAFYGSKVHIER